MMTALEVLGWTVGVLCLLYIPSTLLWNFRERARAARVVTYVDRCRHCGRLTRAGGRCCF